MLINDRGRTQSFLGICPNTTSQNTPFKQNYVCHTHGRQIVWPHSVVFVCLSDCVSEHEYVERLCVLKRLIVPANEQPLPVYMSNQVALYAQ